MVATGWMRATCRVESGTVLLRRRVSVPQPAMPGENFPEEPLFLLSGPTDSVGASVFALVFPTDQQRLGPRPHTGCLWCCGHKHMEFPRFTGRDRGSAREWVDGQDPPVCLNQCHLEHNLFRELLAVIHDAALDAIATFGPVSVQGRHFNSRCVPQGLFTGRGPRPEVLPPDGEGRKGDGDGSPRLEAPAACRSRVQ